MCQEEDLVGRSGNIKQYQCSAARTQLLVQGNERAQTTGSWELYFAQVQMNDRSVRLFDFHERDWAWPGTPDGFPELRRSALPKRPIKAPPRNRSRRSRSWPICSGLNVAYRERV